MNTPNTKPITELIQCRIVYAKLNLNNLAKGAIIRQLNKTSIKNNTQLKVNNPINVHDKR
jgi:hypothetical protein